MTSSAVQIAVAVIVNQQNEVLISLRPSTSHQGGLWEFPGGKIEAGESVNDALKRELLEELDIHLLESHPFKIIRHQYTDKAVVLNIHIVNAFRGEPKGAEGQSVQWKSINQLKPIDFPAANGRVIHALKFPDKYMITGSFTDQNDFLSRLENSLRLGITLVQLRCKNFDEESFVAIATHAKVVCDKYNVVLLLNTSSGLF